MKLADIYARVVGADVPVAFRAFDGSAVGPPDAPALIELRSPRALNYLATARRREIGLARAYITGALDVAGDLYTAMKTLLHIKVDMPRAEKLRIFRALGGTKLLHRPPRPAGEVSRLRGRKHSKRRDAAAIAHHYDVGNDFYELFLGPSMAYTCAVYDSPQTTLEEAQYAKHDLVARKLDLRPGMRLLDVGCGWGGMVLHAARHYGVKALGVTLSARQAEWASRAIEEAGLSELAEVRHLDYRDVAEGDFDAISSIGLTEHIGRAQLASYFTFLNGKLRPGGRLLNHCITRPENQSPAIARGGFIPRYIFPDGELSGPGTLMSSMNDNGFEIRHSENLREHYALTLTAWSQNLREQADAATELAGSQTTRAWMLYLVGSRLGFEANEIQLHQMLGVKLDEQHNAHMPLRPTW